MKFILSFLALLALVREGTLARLKQSRAGDGGRDLTGGRSGSKKFTISGRALDEYARVGIPNSTIQIRNSKGQYRRTLTDRYGKYSFRGLVTGKYEIKQFPVPGYLSTRDTDYGNPDLIIVRLANGDSSGNNFYDVKVYSISGYVLTPDLQGSPLSGKAFTLQLAALDGSYTATTMLNQDGTYTFTKVRPGLFYSITLGTVSGYNIVEDTDTNTEPGKISLYVAGTSDGNNFAVAKTADSDPIFIISGAVRVKDEKGFGISGSKVELTTDGVEVIASTVTPDDGTYSFEGLPAGNYILVQTNAVEPLNFIDVGDTDGANDNRIRVKLMMGISDGNNFYDELECTILETLPPKTLPDCFQRNELVSPDLPFFNSWQWLTEGGIQQKKMVIYDPARPVVMNGIYDRAHQPDLRNNIRLNQTEAKDSLQSMKFWSNAPPGPDSTKDMDIRNLGSMPHIEESVQNLQVDVFGTRYNDDSDCCSTNNTVQEYYVYGIANFTDPDDSTVMRQCEVRICYALIKEQA